MLALLVPQALPVEFFLELFLRTESLLSTGGLSSSFWLALPSCLQVVERELTVDRAVGFHFFTLLLPGNDDIADVQASVDDSAVVACGGVVEVAAPRLVRLDCVVASLGVLRIDEPTTFLLDVIYIFYLDVVWELIPIIASTSSSSGSRK
jgi:hypothetical protein